MALSDLTVRQAKATGTAYTLGDSDGLSLNVSAHGGKSWHFRYYWAGKQKRISLGTYPAVSLRQARLSRDKARILLAQGTNPKAHRRQQKLAVRFADEHTFGVVYSHWMERRQLEIKTGKRSTHAKMVRIFEKDILPFLEHFKIFYSRTKGTSRRHQRGGLDSRPRRWLRGASREFEPGGIEESF
jgi:hypothetical protein